MTASPLQFEVLAYAGAALAHLFVLVSVLRRGRRGGESELPQLVLRGALLASGLWCAAMAFDPWTRSTFWIFAASALDLLRYGLWFVFLLSLLRPGQRLSSPARIGLIGNIALAVLLGASGLWVYRLASGLYQPDALRPTSLLALGLAVLGALLTEQLFRNLPKDSRWNAKPVCLGLAVVFAFDIFLFSEGALLGQLDDDAVAVRGLVHSLALPLLLVAVTRRGDWLSSLQVSHTAAFYSATLVFSGAYLLLMAAVGYYVRYYGGHWGRALQLGLLFAAALSLLLLVFNASLRARLRVFIHKNFFSYRYDYRQEWLHFTAMLTGQDNTQEVGIRVIRGLANMLESPGGALWMRDRHAAVYRQGQRWNMPEVADTEPADSAFCAFLRERAWVIDLDEYRASPRAYGELPLPLWLLSSGPGVWLVVPLIVSHELLGFVILARPRTAVDLNWEVRDLLKTASQQAAGFLAQILATEALLEARKFESFNRMSAFVVHDLKNIVTQLALMLKNAERHADNPEFRQDMLTTVQSSVEKMRRLMLQLREGAPPPGGASGVDLEPIARRLQAAAHSRGREIEIDIAGRLATRGHDERLERVLGHLVHNAIDATAAGGRVWLRMQRQAGQVLVEVGDTGVGMTEDFVKSRLFRPFTSTKEAGMGIGSYESAQYIRELGGRIEVHSRPGEGTRIQVELPLFERESAAGAAASLA
jgi:putative PEP-CTERM system histidine kinase